MTHHTPRSSSDSARADHSAPPAPDVPPPAVGRTSGGPASGGSPPPAPFGDALDAVFGSTSGSDVLDVVGTLPAEQLEPEAALQTELSLWALVFAGGIGSRFWPLSTPERPKPLLALVGERPLIAEAVGRLAPTVPPERVLVVTSADIADALHAAIPEVPGANMLVEPRPMGTAASLAWGAQEVARRAGPKTTLVAMHADLAVGYPDELRRLLARAARLTASDAPLVVLGAEPTRPETGFGYILPGGALDAGEGVVEVRDEVGANGSAPGADVERAPEDDTGPAPGAPVAPGATPRTAARRAQRFVEKPAALLAAELIAAGAFWHTGIVVTRADLVLAALAERTPELQPGLAALAAGRFDRFAGMIQNVSLERGLLERSADLVVLPGAFGWDDVGTWASLRRVRELDDTGNGVWGRAHLVDASSSVVHADGGGTVVVYGMTGVLVVSRPGLTFVTTLDRASELNPLIDALPEALRGRRGAPGGRLADEQG